MNSHLAVIKRQLRERVLVLQGPFDVCRKVFAGGEETARMTINDKSDLFFHDYQMAPLFVQENYPSVTPRAAKYAFGRTFTPSPFSLPVERW